MSTFQAELFGALDRTSIPFSGRLTRRARARQYDMPASIADYPEANESETKAAQRAITTAPANSTVRLKTRVYRTTFTGPVNEGVTIKGPASVRGSDDWSPYGQAGCTWVAAPAPNSARCVVSSLKLPTFPADTSGAPVLTRAHTPSYQYLALNREMVIVDAVPYNRVAAGSTLSVGQWCFVSDVALRQIVVYLADGAANHKIEVVTRLQWVTTLARDTQWNAVDFRHSASGNNQRFAIENSSIAGLAVVDCILGVCHGTAMAIGGAPGCVVLGSVFHNCGAAALQGWHATGAYLHGNVLFNNGGTQSNYANELDTAGFDWPWGSGGFKLSASSGAVTEGNFAWNMGFSSYWSDEGCQSGSVVNNVAWDFRGYGILHEISERGRIAGNVVFQSPRSQFYELDDQIGIYCSSSREVEVGGDTRSGWLDGNLVMCLPIGLKFYWQHSRIGATSGAAPAGGFTGVSNHGNVVIARKSDVAWQWADDVSGADMPPDSGNCGDGNAYGRVGDGAGPDYLWYSSQPSNQDTAPYWSSIEALAASPWEGPGTQWLSPAETALYLVRYGLVL